MSPRSVNIGERPAYPIPCYGATLVALRHIRKGGIVLFTDYLTLFLLFRDYLI